MIKGGASVHTSYSLELSTQMQQMFSSLWMSSAVLNSMSQRKCSTKMTCVLSFPLHMCLLRHNLRAQRIENMQRHAAPPPASYAAASTPFYRAVETRLIITM